MNTAARFISAFQRAYFMPPALAHVGELIRNVPPLRTQHDDLEHMAYLHYANNTTNEHWYITELDINTMQAFGFAVGTEHTGYMPIDLHVLLQMPDVGLDTRFTPRLISEVSHA